MSFFRIFSPVNHEILFLIYDSVIHYLVSENVLTMKDVTLNQKEQARLSVLNSVLEYQVPIVQAAEVLGVSPRHARRLLAAYRQDGAIALAHGNRGRRPHNAIPPAEAAAAGPTPKPAAGGLPSNRWVRHHSLYS